VIYRTFGEYDFTLFGFLLTLLGTVLAALKTVITNLFLSSAPIPTTAPRQGHGRAPSIFKYFAGPAHVTTARPWFNFSLPKLTLTPLQLLYIMSPLAFIQTTLLAYFSGELARVTLHLHSEGSGFLSVWGLGMPSPWLLMNGVLAFGLNVVSFYSNKKIGPVGMSVCGKFIPSSRSFGETHFLQPM